MDNVDLSDKQLAIMADLFEASFIETVQRIAEKQKFKKIQFARTAWPESSPLVARNRWANLRMPDPRKGKPLVCSLSDAYRMARTLGLNMAFVTLQAENLAEERFQQMESESGQNRPAGIAARKKRTGGNPKAETE